MRFEKRYFVMAAAAIMLFATVGTAVGQVTNSLDSVDFDWKYEMNVNPTDVGAINLDKDLYGPDSNLSADWVTGSTPPTFDTVNGVMTMSSNTLLQSGNDPVNLWPNVGFTGADGFTFEIKMKAVKNTTTDIAGFIVGLNDNAGEYGMFMVRENGLNVLNNGGWTLLSTPSNTDADHTFRFARNADTAGGGWWFWRDTQLLNTTPVTPGSTGIPNKIYFGPGVSGGWNGSLEVDYMRLTEGAYQPIQPTYDPPTATKDAAAFDLIYDMNDDPTDPLAIDLDNDTVADWVTSTGPSVTIDGGIMTMLNESTLRSGTAGDGIWPSQSFTAEDGFTCEISMQVDQNEGVEYTSTFVIALSDSDEASAVFIGADSIRWGTQVVLADIDNSDGQHKFRISRDSDEDGGRWWMWRDGELVSEDGFVASNSIPNLDAFYFGPGVSGSSAGTSYVDYVALTDGSFAPVPEPGTLALLLTAALGLLFARRKF